LGHRRSKEGCRSVVKVSQQGFQKVMSSFFRTTLTVEGEKRKRNWITSGVRTPQEWRGV